MKIQKLFVPGLLCAILIFIGCQKNLNDVQNSETESASKAKPVIGSNCSDYIVALTRTTDALTTIFTWTITNPAPGNGSNGTLQNLSHWTFIPGCSGPDGLEQNWNDIINAYWSPDGNTWNLITPIPALTPDPSQTCTSANVFKFAQGTSGAAPTYYKLVLSGHYSVGDMTAFFKSGANTGCCSKTVQGVGCKEEIICSLSQGYYFAKPGPTWPTPGTVEVGGYTYTEAEGRAIWNCSNAGGIKDSKKGFTQVAALKLSGAYPTGNASIDADVVTIETWLSTLGKLVACTNLPTGNAAVGTAAGRIGDWINANHCQSE
jgi:hypothetical protein